MKRENKRKCSNALVLALTSITNGGTIKKCFDLDIIFYLIENEMNIDSLTR